MKNMPFFSSQNKSASGSTPSSTRRAIHTAIWAQSLGAPFPQAMINGGIFSLFILALGGSKFAVGAAFTTNFFAQISRVLVAPYVDVSNRKKMVIFWFSAGVFFGAALLLAHPVSEIWHTKAAMWYAIVVFLFQRLSINIGAAAWMPLLSDIIPSRLRGRFFGRMRRNFQIVSFAFIVAIGWYLGEEPPIWKFYFVFSVLLILAAIRPLLLLRLPHVPPTRQGPRESIIKNLSRPFSDKGFRTFLIFWATLALTVNMARPFGVPFLKEDLGFPSSITAYASAALIMGMVLGLLPWGRVADRFGNRFVFLLNVLLMVLAFNILSVTPFYSDTPIAAMVTGITAFLVTGLSIGGLGIAHTVRQMHVAPSEHRGAYMGVFFTTNGVVSGLITVISGAFLDNLPEVIAIGNHELQSGRVFFNASSVCVLLTLLLLIRLEPVSEKPMRYTVANFISLLPPSFTVPLRLMKLDPHQNKDDEDETANSDNH